MENKNDNHKQLIRARYYPRNGNASPVNAPQKFRENRALRKDRQHSTGIQTEPSTEPPDGAIHTPNAAKSFLPETILQCSHPPSCFKTTPKVIIGTCARTGKAITGSLGVPSAPDLRENAKSIARPSRRAGNVN